VLARVAERVLEVATTAAAASKEAGGAKAQVDVFFSILPPATGMGSRKGNPNPSISAPNDMTMLLAILRIDHEVKGIGDCDGAFYLKVCTAD
jgi:hypothetical protein